MKLSMVYARFYKSFNFDHHRKAHPDAQARPWETIQGDWYPYVEIPIHALVTTVVGANESGKSHLLNAIEIAISGQGFRHQDLCRYCDFFNVERGNDFWPHLGVAWEDVTPAECEALRRDIPDAPARFDSFLMFREGPNRLDIHVPDGRGSFDRFEMNREAASFGQSILPKPFRIHSNVGLPGALPIAEIVPPDDDRRPSSRAQRRGLIEIAEKVMDNWLTAPGEFPQRLADLGPALAGMLSKVDQATTADPDERRLSYDLARRLLIQLGNVEPARLRELSEFLALGEDGHAAALATSINAQLERRLNFPRFWVQDKDFQILVTPHERELVFTIRDRTGTQYTFDERSAGLKYFLSYFIQSQTHEPDPSRSEILLMDEPDAYLSAEAQQDLLKIFTAFAVPDEDARPVQVVYVTHSPFLLDKNHAERIRVLQKGNGSEGTRVIRNASQNHYEPLRSAIGAYVGETAFIGACNLLVEGVADQVLLAGMSRVVQRSGPIGESEALDLNRLVLVPCGSASHVPYMLYLVRGRDSDIPPVLVLLDSDSSGNDAMAVLRTDPTMSRLINPDFLMQVGDLGLDAIAGRPILEPEDLIPPELAAAAAARYFEQVSRFREGGAVEFDAATVAAAFADGAGIFDALKDVARGEGAHIDKIGFARAVVEICEEPPMPLLQHVETLASRMRALFAQLNQRRRRAEQERLREKATAKVERQRRIFVRDHPRGATKEQAVFLFERIEEALDQSLDAEAIRKELLALKHRFGLDGEALDPVPKFSDFLSRLAVLKDSLAIASGLAAASPPPQPARPGNRAPARAKRTVREPGASGAPATKTRRRNDASPDDQLATEPAARTRRPRLPAKSRGGAADGGLES